VDAAAPGAASPGRSGGAFAGFGGAAREGRELLLDPRLAAFRAAQPLGPLAQALEDLEAVVAGVTAVVVEGHG